jgi:WD40 repeat protein
VIVSGGGQDATIRRWDAATGEPIGDPLTGHTSAVRQVTLMDSSERTILISGSEDGTVRRWDFQTGELLGLPLTAHTAEIRGLTISRLGARRVLVTAAWDASLRIWDPDTGRLLLTVGLDNPAIACASSTTGLISVAVGSAVCAFSTHCPRGPGLEFHVL